MRRPSNKIKVYCFTFLVVCSTTFLFVFLKLSLRSEIFSLTESQFDYCYMTEEQERQSEILDDESTHHAARLQMPPSLLEQTRRHISQTARSEWLFLKSQIRILQRMFSNVSEYLQSAEKYNNTLKYMMDHASEYSRVIELEVKKLSKLDGWEKWRRQESEELKNIVRTRLINLQNPANCSDTPVLICNLTNPFGFASGVHDVLWCFIKAYTSHRRLVLDTSHWHYAPNGWQTLFQPLSDVCHDGNEELRKISPWPGRNDNKARWIMRALPQDLGPRIIRLHGNPLAWWYGQFLWYLMRPNNEMKSFMNAVFKQIKFGEGIVGIHVRRTDKVGNEAKAHALKEYMEHAEEYFRSIELTSAKSVKRRVYIATDEPTVLYECQSKYPHYDCLYNPGSAEMASSLETRYSTKSFWCLVTDIFALSQTDYIVCTMSSGVCRVAYELKLAVDETPGDVSDKVSSLDVPHHYAWITPSSRKSIYNHKAKSLREISFRRGDVMVHENDHTIVVAATRGKALDGFMKMLNKMQNTEGFVPIYKTREMYQLRNFSLN